MGRESSTKILVEIPNASDTNIETSSSANTTSTGDASSKQCLGTHEEGQGITSTQSDHAIQEVANAGDDEPLRHIPSSASREVLTTSTPLLATNSYPSSSVVTSHRAVVTNVIDPP
ncbi:hypothetical protein GH714_022421 [Hevea brasiliensis]|uniref:Uncharacterized protein n=1 Tax=Hevea brasiliensis TaxID=3981 RepID=A0A6A6LBD8_HEVBR|nr:hypothetical protein GH714_022421 [Hevea brasiliensis]